MIIEFFERNFEENFLFKSRMIKHWQNYTIIILRLIIEYF